jgi:hypothetical protein
MPTKADGGGDEDGPADDARQLLAQQHYDQEDRVSLSTVVLTAIADARGVDAVDVREPVLHDVVDVEAVESLLFSTSTNGDRDRTDGAVTFEYDRTEVVVRSNGWVQLYDDADERAGEANADERAGEANADERAGEANADER